ncbi:MAG: class I SAM-dependent methyltransferase [Anaerolineae bacterium]
MLDIGCGRGNLLVGLNQEGWDCWGLERPEFVDPSATAYKLLLSPQEVEALEDGSFDLVVMWHSLEHMSDPAATVALATRLLKPGGLLTIAVPNFDSTQRRWFGRHWFAMSVPVHRQHLSRRPLERLLTPHYDVLRFSTMALEQGTFIFAHSVVNALTDSHEPNPLYERLSLRQPGSAGMLSLVLQGVALLAALPVGFVESLVSGWLDRGTVLTLVAQKRRES